MRQPLVLAALLIATAPAMAFTVTARVSGGNIPVHAGPHTSYAIVARLSDGTEIAVDECTQVDGDSRFGNLGDAGYPLSGKTAVQWCRIPGTGWVQRDWITGRGLVNVTPPDFAGSGW